jgi:DNA-directed RNA polymerase subunit alpha
VKIAYQVKGRSGGERRTVAHPYERIPGVVEDVRQILANLRQVGVWLVHASSYTLSVSVRGPTQVQAADLFTGHEAHVLAANSTQPIARLGKTVQATFVITVSQGGGFVRGKLMPGEDLFTLKPDADFRPVRRVGYRGCETGIEWTVETNGGCPAEKAWRQALRLFDVAP